MAQKIIDLSKNILNVDNTNENVNPDDLSLLEKKCKKYLRESNKNLTHLIDAFNNLSIEISKLLVNELPLNKDIKTLNVKLVALININCVEPISMFIKNVYCHSEYRISLKSGNDTFFTGLSKDTLKKHSDVIKPNDENIQKFFEFKSYWANLSDETKNKIKEIMKVLVDLTDKYIEIKDDTNDIAKILISVEK